MIEISEDVAFVGPPLSEGPLPTLFYLSLSAKESLTLDPFNQPVTYLSQFPLRIFSITLPGHENNLPAKEALNRWADELEKGNNIIVEFINKTKETVNFLLEKKLLIENKLAIAGLSRGAFLATHAAAQIPLFKIILGFAPLTKLDQAKEFQRVNAPSFNLEAAVREGKMMQGFESELAPLEVDHSQKVKATPNGGDSGSNDCGNLPSRAAVSRFNLEHLTPQLTDRALRFYIGNLDKRVSTRACFDFIETLAQTAHQHQIRSPQVELMISPSIGKDGHGTSQEIFHQGAQWIANRLGVIHGV